MDHREQAAAKASIKDFYTFLRNFWHVVSTDQYIDNWHVHYLCGELQKYGHQIARRDKALPDLIINVSPGSSKSTIVSQMFNAWLWLHAPWACVISSSYSYDLSRSHSSKTKEIILSDRYQKWYQSYYKKRFKKALKFKKNTERFYQNNFGGFRYATGTDGAVMGQHAHVLLIDDPMNMRQSESPAYREKANTFSVAGLGTRKKDKTKTPTILVMQRLHEVDTTGYMIEKAEEKGKAINQIVMPAILTEHVKPKHLSKYYINGYFDPVRLPQESLDDQRIDLGSYGYSGQFGQRPYPDEGGKVNRDWFKFIRLSDLPPGLTWDIWIDGAYTDRSKNDPTGIMKCAYDRVSNKLYIKRWRTKRMELPHLVKHMKNVEYDHPDISEKSKTHIEPKASGHSLKQYLTSETDKTVVLISSQYAHPAAYLVAEGKEARLQTASPKIESGQVVLVEDDWNKEFMDQICFFPNAAEDEAVDCLGYAAAYYFKKKKRKGAKIRG
jgi:predicted phage terminase large subunit-like protein